MSYKYIQKQHRGTLMLLRASQQIRMNGLKFPDNWLIHPVVLVDIVP